MKRTLSTPMLVLPAVAVWLAACGLLSRTQLAYDGAVFTNHIYFWVYGGALLLIGLGLWRGEADVVLHKGIKLCLECVGIG